jgi:putative ABC transport system permease protein
MSAMWSGMGLDRLAQDARYAIRQLRKTPAFTVTAIVVLAIGIGANTAIFSFVNGVILRPLGYGRPEQLMTLSTHFPLFPQLKFASYGLAPPEYLDFRDVYRPFVSVGAFTTDEVNLTAGDRPLRVRSASVDEQLLRTLGVPPAEGRLFRDGETTAVGPAPPAIAILSHELWQGAFGGQPMVGRTVDVDGRPHEVLGVMPPGADVMDHRVEIWLPLGLNAASRQNTGGHYLNVIGRLRDGVTPAAAQSELESLLGNWASRVNAAGADHYPTNHPKAAAEHVIVMRPVRDAILGDASRAIWILQAAVGLVLLIVCANLANLFVARAGARRREYAVRAALGAGRGQLLRQSITEGILLALAGGMLGAWLAQLGVRALLTAYPSGLPRANDVAVDTSVLVFALLVSTVTGLAFGILPAAHTRLGGMVTALKEGGEKGGQGAARHHIRRVLVMAEVALAVMLVIGAGLLVRSVYNLTTLDAGFDRARLVTFSMTLPTATTAPAARLQAYQRLLDKLRGAPGIQGASAMSGLPPTRAAIGRGTLFENHTAATGEPFEVVDYYQQVMSDYFETMGIAIVAGRGFQRGDTAATAKVVVINETLVNAVFQGRNPVGQRLQPYNGPQVGPWYTIVGVAKDVKQGGLDQKTGSEIYMLSDQRGVTPPQMHLVLRTTLPPAALVKSVDSLVREVDRSVPVVRLRDMDAVYAESIRRPRFLAQLLGAFAGLALLLAAVGTYGVLAYVVAERRREIGIRMALGASRGRVVGQVMKEGLLLTSLGLVAGLAGAFALSRVMGSLLYGVASTDALTFAAVIPTIALVAVLASMLPAWRAARLDPSRVLRDG